MYYFYSEELKEKLKNTKLIFDFYHLKLRKFPSKKKHFYKFNLIKTDNSQCLIIKQKECINPYKLFEIIEQQLKSNNYYNNKLSKVMCINENKIWESLT